MASVTITHTTLLFVVIAGHVAPWAAVSAFSSNGNGCGDSTEPECKAPPYSDPSQTRVNPTDEELQELVLEGRCYLACATENYQDDTVMYSNVSTYWPFRASADKSDCTISGSIHECIRGCVQRTSSSSRTCSGLCRSSCTSECGGRESCENPDMRDPWNHPDCPVICYNDRFNPRNPCNLGCREVLNAQPDGGAFSPRDPIGPPLLTPVTNTERAGLFAVDLSDASPQPGEGSVSGDSPTQPEVLAVAFLFRIKERSSQNISYIWMPDPLAPLNLIDYACQDLMVSFAVVNKEAGLSNFSPITNVTVNISVEQFIPDPPMNLQVLDEVDTRVGFFGYAVLNISWDRPINDSFLEHFIISISSNMDGASTVCGSNVIISSNDTYIIVEADSRLSLPVLNCSYRIEVFSVGYYGCSERITKSHETRTDYCGTPNVANEIAFEPFNNTPFDAVIVFDHEEGLLPDTIITAICTKIDGLWNQHPASFLCMNQSLVSCSAPLVPTNAHISNESRNMIYLEGTNVTFQCNSRLQLSLTSTCHNNGDWIPLPSELDCNPSNSVTRKVLSSSNQIIIVACFICCFVFLVGIFIGALCHHWARILMKNKEVHTPPPTGDSEVTEAIKLADNIAYGPI